MGIKKSTINNEYEFKVLISKDGTRVKSYTEPARNAKKKCENVLDLYKRLWHTEIMLRKCSAHITTNEKKTCLMAAYRDSRDDMLVCVFIKKVFKKG